MPFWISLPMIKMIGDMVSREKNITRPVNILFRVIRSEILLYSTSLFMACVEFNILIFGFLFFTEIS